MTEAEASEVRDAILSGWIATGPRTKELERQIASYVGTERAVCLNSQTACAEMALRLLGIGEGDEVIVPAYTYTASASVVYHVGAKIVFVDVQKDCLEMNYEAVEKAITERTKVIIPDSAHGTNPASSAVCGLDVVVVKSRPDGTVDVDDLRPLLDDTIAGMMMTNPNTLGIFEHNIGEIAKAVHDCGGLMYYNSSLSTGNRKMPWRKRNSALGNTI